MPPRRYQPRRGPRPPRRRNGGAAAVAEAPTPVRPEGPVELPSSIAVKDLADALTVSTADVIKELIRNGIFATINQSIDFDTASLVARELGIETVERGVAERAAAEAAGPAGDRGARRGGRRRRQAGALHRGRRGRPRHPGADRDDHGPRRPRQDLASGRDPQYERGAGGAGWHHSAHRRQRGRAQRQGSSSWIPPVTRRSRRCAPVAPR